MEMLKKLGGALVLLALAGALFFFYGPELLKDVTHMGDDAQYAEQHDFVDGSCDGRLVFYLCDVKVSGATVEGASKTLRYFMIDMPGGSKSVGVEEYTDGTVTTSLGRAYLWNRVIMMILFGGGFLLAGFAVLFGKGDDDAEAV